MKSAIPVQNLLQISSTDSKKPLILVFGGWNGIWLEAKIDVIQSKSIYTTNLKDYVADKIQTSSLIQWTSYFYLNYFSSIISNKAFFVEFFLQDFAGFVMRLLILTVKGPLKPLATSGRIYFYCYMNSLQEVSATYVVPFELKLELPIIHPREQKHKSYSNVHFFSLSFVVTRSNNSMRLLRKRR